MYSDAGELWVGDRSVAAAGPGQDALEGEHVAWVLEVGRVNVEAQCVRRQ
jgi:hypothetical protein